MDEDWPAAERQEELRGLRAQPEGVHEAEWTCVEVKGMFRAQVSS